VGVASPALKQPIFMEMMRYKGNENEDNLVINVNFNHEYINSVK
jgi:hypothetical protein